MIKKFIDKLLSKANTVGRRSPVAVAPAYPFGQRQEIPACVHGIDPRRVDARAVDVVAVLAGFEALLEDVEACVAPGIVSF